MMPVRNLRRYSTVALVALAIIDLAAAAVLLSPLAGTRTSKLRQAEEVRKQWQDEARKALPVRDIDKKIQQARAELGDFYGSRFPTRSSSVAIELGKVANENGVRLSNVHYVADDEATEGVRRIQMDASLSGDYLKVVKFINTLERDKTFFLVDSVTLGEQQAGTVTLQIHLETYVREGSTGTS